MKGGDIVRERSPLIRRVWVVYAVYGDGHRSAAEAVAEAVRTLHPETDVVVEDFMERVHPRFHRLLQRIFYFALRRAPSAYRTVYNVGAPQKLLFRDVLALVRLAGRAPLLARLRELSPDLVISTHFLATQELAELRARGELLAPLVTVVTDYAVHPFWVHPANDLYFVGSREGKEVLGAFGFPDTRAFAVGLPLRAQFWNADAEGRLRFPLFQESAERPLRLLFMGGGLGMLDSLPELLLALDRLPFAKEYVVVAGRNAPLYRALSEYRGRLQGSLVVYGFVEEVRRLMEEADLLVTKAGGLSVAEAWALGLPIFLYRPLPGHEEENAKLLEAAGVARLVRSPEELLRRVTEFAARPYRGVPNPLRLRAALETVRIVWPYAEEHVLYGSGEAPLLDWEPDDLWEEGFSTGERSADLFPFLGDRGEGGGSDPSCGESPSPRVPLPPGSC
ncbi:MGDG synthase family glycosyltransferase [Brockia lithotrophica]|uniref:Processive 1,2-diacylglycerol beta-glucosyltransferase n=1 Tax=Brockia lithotrophica TaxID=933949 RepID=A0A660L4R7_9BACL|nr:glycosyltransferase [Brockia lithotrophica]RKQ88916.1 processive 1,2-diacylglycerol beta-glucosyltransferase [Brockia lithotrophica]